jgi:hypothetical protein
MRHCPQPHKRMLIAKTKTLMGRGLVGLLIATVLGLATVRMASDADQHPPSQASALRYAVGASHTPSHSLRGSATFAARGLFARWTPTLLATGIAAAEIYGIRFAEPQESSAAHRTGVTLLRGYDSAAPPL